MLMKKYKLYNKQTGTSLRIDADTLKKLDLKGFKHIEIMEIKKKKRLFK
jgi:aspartate 1-decarboxylase